MSTIKITLPHHDPKATMSWAIITISKLHQDLGMLKEKSRGLPEIQNSTDLIEKALTDITMSVAAGNVPTSAIFDVERIMRDARIGAIQLEKRVATLN